jgi:selenocysteine lyase/cysteine desulfurase
MDAGDFRAQFPVLEQIAYFNTGTDGPVPRRAYDAASIRLRGELERGRAGEPHFKLLMETAAALRARLAEALGCDAGEVALTHSTTDGVSTALSSLPLGPGDEVLTSDVEHPGLLAPLEAARRRRGFEVRFAPFDELAGAVGPSTKLVACSHVSWADGRVVDVEGLRASGAQVLLDGAQGLGAVAVDVRAIGCDFYAASGQKWLCGPVGTGMLHVAPAWQERLAPAGPTYMAFEDVTGPLDQWRLHPGARRHDTPAIAAELSAAAVSAHDQLESFGWDRVHARARDLAAAFAARLAESGRVVAPRGPTTLVAWEDADPPATVERLAARGIAIRNLPGTPYLRASVGAWNDTTDLERLLEAL